MVPLPESRAHAHGDVMNEDPLSQPTNPESITPSSSSPLAHALVLVRLATDSGKARNLWHPHEARHGFRDGQRGLNPESLTLKAPATFHIQYIQV